MPAILLFLFHSLLQNPLVDTAYELIIGSYTREGNPGIEIMDVNTLRNHSVPRYAIQNPNSSFLAVSADRSRMFSVREEGQAKSAIAAFRRNARGEYEFVNSSAVIGNGPCHVAYREASATVYAANYGSGSLSVFKTVDGRLEPIAQHIKYTGSGPDKSRQQASHAHQVTVSSDQHFLYVTDLGGDKVYRHRIYADGLVDEVPQVISVAPGSGPRHLVFNSKGDHMYLINELNAMVNVFLVRQDAFTLLQSILADTARSASKGSGDIHLSPDGRWLLTSNRISSNEITVFEVLGDGTLKKVRHQPVLKKPRNFNFTPDGKSVYVASQDEHKVQVFAFNGADGSMTDTGRDIPVKNPVCLIFFPREDMANPEERISSLNIRLIKPSAPIANYVKCVQAGNLVFLSGHGPDKPEGGQVLGKLGRDLSVEQGQEAARLTGISLISTLRGLVGDLNRVKRIVKVTGLVNCADTFTQQPAVMNGFSNLMVDLFGERGRHARTSVGVNALPNNIAVEIEMVVELK